MAVSLPTIRSSPSVSQCLLFQTCSTKPCRQPVRSQPPPVGSTTMSVIQKLAGPSYNSYCDVPIPRRGSSAAGMTNVPLRSLWPVGFHHTIKYAPPSAVRVKLKETAVSRHSILVRLAMCVYECVRAEQVVADVAGETWTVKS